jgi:hypothetical protein
MPGSCDGANFFYDLPLQKTRIRANGASERARCRGQTIVQSLTLQLALVTGVTARNFISDAGRATVAGPVPYGFVFPDRCGAVAAYA